MKTRVLLILVAALTVLFNAATFPVSAQSNRVALANQIPDQYIVLLKGDPGTDQLQAMEDLSATHNIKIKRKYKKALNGFSATGKAKDIQKLAEHPQVAHIIPDLIMHATVQSVSNGISRIGGEPGNPNATNQGAGIDVAILDSGIDLDHPDLMPIAGGVDFTGTGNGGDDDFGHGTKVAGIVAARDNNIDVVGVAPQARIWSVKVLNQFGSGSLSGVVAGIDWVADTSQRQDDPNTPGNEAIIEVANMSLGGGRPNPDPIEIAINNATALGTTFVVAAGNNFQDAEVFSPAHVDGAITVSALDDNNGVPSGNCADANNASVDCFAFFSNWGSGIDLIAPGVGLLTTAMGGGTASFAGTSEASPHVAGRLAGGR